MNLLRHINILPPGTGFVPVPGLSLGDSTSCKHWGYCRKRAYSNSCPRGRSCVFLNSECLLNHTSDGWQERPHIFWAISSIYRIPETTFISLFYPPNTITTSHPPGIGPQALSQAFPSVEPYKSHQPLLPIPTFLLIILKPAANPPLWNLRLDFCIQAALYTGTYATPLPRSRYTAFESQKWQNFQKYHIICQLSTL